MSTTLHPAAAAVAERFLDGLLVGVSELKSQLAEVRSGDRVITGEEWAEWVRVLVEDATALGQVVRPV